jgi:hypothetical protein
MNFRHSLTPILLPFLLGSCTAFAPTYNEAIYSKLDGAHSSLTKIETTMETKAPSRTQYRDVEPYYIDALAQVKEAGDIAGKRPAYLHGRPAAKAAELVADNIGRCHDAIEESRASFDAKGQAPNEADNIAIARNTCAIAKTMEGALK